MSFLKIMGFQDQYEILEYDFLTHNYIKVRSIEHCLCSSSLNSDKGPPPKFIFVIHGCSLFWASMYSPSVILIGRILLSLARILEVYFWGLPPWCSTSCLCRGLLMCLYFYPVKCLHILLWTLVMVIPT